MKTNEPQGIILVMTVIIMAILLAIAIAFSVIINSDLHQAKMVDDAVVAYYGAEAGAERNIFFLRKMGQKQIPEEKERGPFSLANSAQWDIKQSTNFESTVVRQRLGNGQSLKLYFLDRAATLAKSVKIDFGTVVGSPKLQTTFTQLTPQFDQDKALVYYTDYSKVEDLSGDVWFCYNFKDLYLVEPPLNISDYVVELKILGQDDSLVNSVTVRAYNSADCTGDQNETAVTNMTIRSLGQYNKAQQMIIVNIPVRDPLSGLASFVLFSGGDIVKDY